MANEEHVERLLRSVEGWNKWRRQGYFTSSNNLDDMAWWQRNVTMLSRIDLSKAILSEAKLFEADLRLLNLSEADLRKADLVEAMLSRSYLFKTDLRRANLHRAHLIETDLRRANLTKTDLSGADLRGAKLSGADLSEANLTAAVLSGAVLTRANLTGVVLRESDLSNADFNRTDLTGADLSRANCTETNFTKAILSRVNLIETDLNGADFTEVQFYHTTFAWGDLSFVKGLEAAVHYGPSTVNINSVTLPLGEHVRKHFLQGVGFTETQIEYLPSLLTPRPIEYSSLFISYSHKDDAIAKRLYNDLRKKDVPCWFAPHDLRPGTLIVRGIEEAIHQQDKLLLILSRHAINSPWVQQEVEAALYKEATTGEEILFPIRLDNMVLESETLWAQRLRTRHIGDFTNWQDEAAYNQAFTTLLKHLKVDKTSTV